MSPRTGKAYSRDSEPHDRLPASDETGVVALLLAAAAAALVSLLGVTSASATTLPVAETLVGATTPSTHVFVGVHESEPPKVPCRILLSWKDVHYAKKTDPKVEPPQVHSRICSEWESRDPARTSTVAMITPLGRA